MDDYEQLEQLKKVLKMFNIPLQRRPGPMSMFLWTIWTLKSCSNSKNCTNLRVKNWFLNGHLFIEFFWQCCKNLSIKKTLTFGKMKLYLPKTNEIMIIVISLFVTKANSRVYPAFFYSLFGMKQWLDQTAWKIFKTHCLSDSLSMIPGCAFYVAHRWR